MIFNVCNCCPACPCRADVDHAAQVCADCQQGLHLEARVQRVQQRARIGEDPSRRACPECEARMATGVRRAVWAFGRRCPSRIILDDGTEISTHEASA